LLLFLFISKPPFFPHFTFLSSLTLSTPILCATRECVHRCFSFLSFELVDRSRIPLSSSLALKLKLPGFRAFAPLGLRLVSPPNVTPLMSLDPYSHVASSARE
jgi:hypothetical protein